MRTVPHDRNADVTEPSQYVRYRPPVVRTRSRSHNSRLALAGLGVMAALVALAGNAQPAEPVDAAVSQETPSEIVRAVDFSTVAQPGASCTEALADSEISPRRIPVERGASQLLDETFLVRLEVDDEVLYGDLDGDGDDEAVVHAVCNYGANGAEHTVQVWTVNVRVPVLVAAVSDAPAHVADESDLPPAVHDVAIDGSELLVTFTRYADGDPHCCPSGQTTVAYELDDGLEPVGQPVTGALQP